LLYAVSIIPNLFLTSASTAPTALLLSTSVPRYLYCLPTLIMLLPINKSSSLSCCSASTIAYTCFTTTNAFSTSFPRFWISSLSDIIDTVWNTTRKETIELFISRISYPITEYEDYTTTQIPRKSEYADFATEQISRKTEYEDFTTEQIPRRTEYEEFMTKQFLSDTILEENPTGDIFKPLTPNRADNSDNFHEGGQRSRQRNVNPFSMWRGRKLWFPYYVEQHRSSPHLYTLNGFRTS